MVVRCTGVRLLPHRKKGSMIPMEPRVCHTSKFKTDPSEHVEMLS